MTEARGLDTVEANLTETILVGLMSLAIIVAITFAMGAAVDTVTFSTWVGLIWMSGIPAQFILANFLGFSKPDWITRTPQPLKGVLFFLVNAVLAIAIAAIVVGLAGTGTSPPPPMVIMFIISSVAVTFHWMLCWRGAPFSPKGNYPLLAAAGLLTCIYAITFLLFTQLFNFSFLKGAPVYSASLDPGGLFPAWDILITAVTSAGVLILFLQMDFYPVRVPRNLGVGLGGLLTAILSLTLGFATYYVATRLLGADPVVFMLFGPVAFIAGFLITGPVVQDRLFTELLQPLRGIVIAVLSAVLGGALALGYYIFGKLVTDIELAAGAPTYDREIWTATALLGLSFPLITTWTGALEFWPFIRPMPSRSGDHE